MKIDPYMQQQKCRPMTLVSGNIRYMGILASRGFILAGTSNESGVVDDGNFFCDLTGYFRDKASSIT